MKKFFVTVLLCISSFGFSDVLYWQLNSEPCYMMVNDCKTNLVEFDIRVVRSICRSANFSELMNIILYEVMSETAVEITDDVSNMSYSFSFENFMKIEFGKIKLNGLYL